MQGGANRAVTISARPTRTRWDGAFSPDAIPQSEAFYAQVSTILQGISDAHRDDTKLPPDAVGLIGMTSIPICDILKTARAYKFPFTDDEIALISELVAMKSP